MNVGRVLVSVLAILFVFESIAWVTGVPHRKREYSLIDEWRSGIGALGITPVFPPREDVQVGDLYLRMAQVGNAGQSGGLIAESWLGNLQLAEPLQEFYKTRFAMPVETAENDTTGKENSGEARQAALPTAASGIFRTGDVPTRLRNVSFPNLTVASTRSAKLSVADTLLRFVNTGTFSEVGYNVTVGIPDAEGYGVPALLIISAIGKYCPEKFAENIGLLTKSSFSGEPTATTIDVVTGVYYARSIDYTVSRRNGVGGTAAVTPDDLDKLKRLLAELARPKPMGAQSKPQDEKAKAAASPPGPGGTGTPPASGYGSSDAGREEELFGRIKEELEKMTVALEHPNAPAVAGSVIRSDAQSVTLRRIFSQPIIIGYQSLSFDMHRFEGLICHAPSPPPPSQCVPPKICAEPTYLSPQPPKPRLPDAKQVYLVFFDWDEYHLTPEGMQVVATAANRYKTGHPVRIAVTGYTDLSGMDAYNQSLSERRAGTVAATLGYLGVAARDMDVTGLGMNNPRVPTPPGVREPQNRRVEIRVPN